MTALMLFGLAGLVSLSVLRRKLSLFRAVFTVMALTGAFGTLLGSLRWGLVLAVALERLLLSRLWSALMRFRARPVTPLAGLVLETARAVTRFKNGRGIVAVERDGREVQLMAVLWESALEAKGPVEVGDRLRVVDVDVTSERLFVSQL
jgi:hypothetical protein